MKIVYFGKSGSFENVPPPLVFGPPLVLDKLPKCPPPCIRPPLYLALTEYGAQLFYLIFLGYVSTVFLQVIYFNKHIF